MRILLFTCMLMVTGYCSFAQKKNKVAVFVAPSANSFISKTRILNDAGYSGRGAISVGVGYQRKINKIFSIESGIEYSRHKIRGSFVSSGEESIVLYDFDVVSVPLYANLSFSKYFFMSGGLFLGISSKTIHTDPGNGIGAGFGIGGKYRLKDLEIYINPFFRNQSIISFNKDDNDYYLTEFGAKFGLAYYF